MSIGGYVGVNNAPRKIVDMYVGVANQPRRVLKAYIGDAQNQPRLWYYFYPPEPLDYNSIYYKYNSGTFTTFGGRWYAKVNDGETYAFSAWLPENWTFGFVVSQYKKAVESNCSYQSGYIHKADGSGGGSFVMYNHLWYWTHAPFAWQGCHNCDPQTNFIDFRSNSNIPATHDFIEYETVCKEFLKIIYAEIATPVMSSNSSPYNSCSASSTYGSNWDAWKAFRQFPDVNGWSSADGRTVGEWLQYRFDSPTKIVKVNVINRNFSAPAAVKKFKIQGSNDGYSYTDLRECTMSSNDPNYTQNFVINNSNSYYYYRFYVLEGFETGTVVTFGCINMYKEI